VGHGETEVYPRVRRCPRLPLRRSPLYPSLTPLPPVARNDAGAVLCAKHFIASAALTARSCQPGREPTTETPSASHNREICAVLRAPFARGPGSGSSSWNTHANGFSGDAAALLTDLGSSIPASSATSAAILRSVRGHFDRLDNRGIVVLGFVDPCRNRPHPHQPGREWTHQSKS
jgi:hypothetical protein